MTILNKLKAFFLAITIYLNIRANGFKSVSCEFHSKYCFKTSSTYLAGDLNSAEKICRHEKVLTIPDKETEKAVKNFIFDAKVWLHSKILLSLTHHDRWYWKLGNSKIPMKYSNWMEGRQPKTGNCAFIQRKQGWSASRCEYYYLVVCMSLKCKSLWSSFLDLSHKEGTPLPFIEEDDNCADYCEFFMNDCKGVNVIDNVCYVYEEDSPVISYRGSLHLKRSVDYCKEGDALIENADVSRIRKKFHVSHQQFSWIAKDERVMTVSMFVNIGNFILFLILSILIYKTIKLYRLIRNVADHLAANSRMSGRSFFHSSIATI